MMIGGFFPIKRWVTLILNFRALFMFFLNKLFSRIILMVYLGYKLLITTNHHQNQVDQQSYHQERVLNLIRNLAHYCRPFQARGKAPEKASIIINNSSIRSHINREQYWAYQPRNIGYKLKIAFKVLKIIKK